MRTELTLVEMRHPNDENRVPPADAGFARIVTLNRGRGYTPMNVLRGMVGSTPLSVLNYYSPQLAAELAAALKTERFDAVQLESVHLMKFLPVIRQAAGSPAILIDWHNIESELMWRFSATTSSLAKKLVAKRTASLLERAELYMLDQCDTHTVVSERERQKILALRPNANIHVVPNGVDAAFYAPTAARRFESPESNAPPRLLFVGSMDYHANIDAMTWFVQEIWPAISRRHPELQFTIVGRDPGPSIRALASSRIEVTGTVDDVRHYYASATAVMVPLRSGSGTRLKILEAMAAGVPIISTRLGAEGIEAQNDVHLLLADTPDEMLAAVTRLISSPGTQLSMAQQAQTLVTQRYDWSSLGESLYRIHCTRACPENAVKRKGF
jgi:glycosyltransferase involved in cell wall biosynthesis